MSALCVLCNFQVLIPSISKHHRQPHVSGAAATGTSAPKAVLVSSRISFMKGILVISFMKWLSLFLYPHLGRLFSHGVYSASKRHRAFITASRKTAFRTQCCSLCMSLALAFG